MFYESKNIFVCVLLQFDISKIKNHSGRLMPERLLEFNRLELKRRLENKAEEIQLIVEVQHLLKITYPDR